MLRILRRFPADKIKLLIFDLDGTLVDSRLDLANSVNATLRNYDRPSFRLTASRNISATAPPRSFVARSVQG